MTTRTKAWWLFVGAALLLTTPYVVVFAIGSVQMWRHGLIWWWAVGTGLPTAIGIGLLEQGRRLIFSSAVALPHTPPESTHAGQAAMQDVRSLSQRLQAQDQPLDQPEVLEKVAREVLSEVLKTVARHYRPQVDRPELDVPVKHIAALVALVADDFRTAFSETIPYGNTLTPKGLLDLKEKGAFVWTLFKWLWEINRVRRFIMWPGTALVQEVQDHVGHTLATGSVNGLKRWAIDYCITKAGHYAIQLYSGGFVQDDEYRSRVSPRPERALFENEPLQILVVGQVKSGKSSLINALLGETRALVDTLPATDSVDSYEREPDDRLPRIICRDTPGYGIVADNREPFNQLKDRIRECDLLLMVCSSRSAARKTDCELLAKVREEYQRNVTRSMPPIVYVLTHIDMVPEHQVAEAMDAVAADFGMGVDHIVSVCVKAGWLTNLKGVVDAIREKLPEAERLKVSRCIRQIRKEEDENKIVQQIITGGRLLGGWIFSKPPPSTKISA